MHANNIYAQINLKKKLGRKQIALMYNNTGMCVPPELNNVQELDFSQVF